VHLFVRILLMLSLTG